MPGLFSGSYFISQEESVVADIIFFLTSSRLSNNPITPLGFSSVLLIFLVGFTKSIIFVPLSVIIGSGILNVSPYFLLKRSAISLVNSTCCF